MNLAPVRVEFTPAEVGKRDWKQVFHRAYGVSYDSADAEFARTRKKRPTMVVIDPFTFLVNTTAIYEIVMICFNYGWGIEFIAHELAPDFLVQLEQDYTRRFGMLNSTAHMLVQRLFPGSEFLHNKQVRQRIAQIEGGQEVDLEAAK